MNHNNLQQAAINLIMTETASQSVPTVCSSQVRVLAHSSALTASPQNTLIFESLVLRAAILKVQLKQAFKSSSSVKHLYKLWECSTTKLKQVQSDIDVCTLHRTAGTVTSQLGALGRADCDCLDMSNVKMTRIV